MHNIKMDSEEYQTRPERRTQPYRCAVLVPFLLSAALLLPECLAFQVAPTAVRSLHRRKQHQCTTSTGICKDTSIRNTVLFSSPSPWPPPTFNAADSKERAGKDGFSVRRQPVRWNQDDPDGDENENYDYGGGAVYTRPRERVTPLQGSGGSGWLDNDNDNDNIGGGQRSTNQLRQLRESILRTAAQQNDEDEEEEDEKPLDLYQRTMETLDYPRVLRALSKHCMTVPAKKLVLQATTHSPSKNHDTLEQDVLDMPLTASSVEGVHTRYRAVEEMQRVRSMLQSGEYAKLKPCPLTTAGTRLDMEPLLAMAKGELIDSPQSQSQSKSQPQGPLQGPEILELASMLEVLQDLAKWCHHLTVLPPLTTSYNQEKAPFAFTQLPKFASFIDIDREFQNTIQTALDDKGRLNGETFPTLGRLRVSIQNSKRDILQTVSELLTTPSLKAKLALDGGGSVLSEINGHVVIPIASEYQNAVPGVVHDTSRSGRTVYMEPAEIVGLTKELQQAQVALEREEYQTWLDLTERVVEQEEPLRRAVAAAAQVDLAWAKVLLGEQMVPTTTSDAGGVVGGGGVIPEVKSDGVMQLDHAQHPVLLLRQLPGGVVGSSVRLGLEKNCGLVLTGPNAGGKTVFLKLMGLMALMTRDGLLLPAAAAAASRVGNNGGGSEANLGDEGEIVPPRVDFFNPILADIGDLQSVGDDLSTFSGHMLVCREVLSNAGANSLVLMDEMGSGTDPAQGVAIAQALLEALVDGGAKVAITTHYLALKQLATSDERFDVAGMQFVNGRPTYKLMPGVVGESFALAVAERLELPPNVISRAHELLDDDTRRMGDLIRDLEDQKNTLDVQVQAMQQREEEMEEKRADMERAQKRLEQQQLNARREEAKRFAAKLEEKERVLEEVLAKLKADPSRKILAKSWDDIQFVKRDALREAEVSGAGGGGKKNQLGLPEDSTLLIPVSEMEQIPELKVGDSVMVCKKGAAMGKSGTIIKLPGPKKKTLEVKVGPMPLRLKWSEVALPTQRMVNEQRNTNQNGAYAGLSKAARKALELEGRDKTRGGGRAGNGDGTENVGGERSKGSTMRTESNTLDLRGCTLLESQERSVDFFSRSIMSNRNVVYLLHGHGTGGVLKRKLRDWLRRERDFVKRFKAADSSDGGDAFTMVELKDALKL